MISYDFKNLAEKHTKRWVFQEIRQWYFSNISKGLSKYFTQNYVLNTFYLPDSGLKDKNIN